ncbi:MAG: DNA-processing protein DprA [Pseudomonadales bacterium]|nr:DNA-processing protein DprA [Pseudomonadales bacterium]
MSRQADSLDPSQLWLSLSLIPSLTPAKMKAFATPHWDERAAALALRGVPVEEWRQAWEQLPRLLEWLAREGNAVLPLYAPDYPPLLAALPDPPPALYLQGRLEALQLPQMAMVGTRKPSVDGRRLAREFGAALAQSGYVVTSGLALGIDAESHAGALAQGGLTVAVLGSGLAQLYPKANTALAARIREQGVLVSEFPPWSGPANWHFPFRNRVISGLSHGVLVVEAAAKSGSLITARLAAEQGREVFAIPGAIHNPQTRGCHALLRTGAKLVESVADILEELPAFAAWERQRLKAQSVEAKAPAVVIDEASLSPQERDIVKALGYGEVSLEQLVRSVNLPVELLLGHLSELELRGLIRAGAGGFSCAN